VFVVDDDGNDVNVALGGTATQSSTYNNNDDQSGAQKAIDGNTELGITHTMSSADPWWKVDLGTSYDDVTKIVIWNRQNDFEERLSHAKVSLLDAYENVVIEFDVGDATDIESVTFDVDWNQNWTISFAESGHDLTDVQQFGATSSGDSMCFLQNDAFNRAFDDFAAQYVIEDAADEEQCEAAREGMGFERDHPFDTEVCAQFQSHMCDPFFSGMDHLTDGLGVTAPPQFEMVEYEEVEYEEVEYKEAADYEEAEYVTVEYNFEEYDEDDELPFEEIVVYDIEADIDTDEFSLLNDMQATWLDLQRDMMAYERLEAFVDDIKEDACSSTPDLVCALGCSNIPAKAWCFIAKIALMFISHWFLLLTDIAYQEVNRKYELATEAPSDRLYSQKRITSTYEDLRKHIKWNHEALTAINNNMKSQHTDIRQNLQDRHSDMERNIGTDINEARNALGQSIVDTQNALGQTIIDSQNANGQLIVDAQNAIGQHVVDARNANGQAIVDARNAVSDQHNQMLQWLYTNLCTINSLAGGSCNQFIGPLEEGQTLVPLQLHRPEGQASLIEKLERIETRVLKGGDIEGDAKPGAYHAVDGKMMQTADVRVGLYGSAEAVEEKVDKVEGKIDAIKMAVDGKVDAVDGKVDAVDGKVDAVDGKVDAVGVKIDAIKMAVDGKVDAVDGKVDAVDGKVESIKSNVKAVEGKIDAVELMMMQLVEQNTKLVQLIESKAEEEEDGF